MEMHEVTPISRHLGFRVPVLVTGEAWEVAVAWESRDSLRQVAQDEQTRLNNLLWAVAWTVLRQGTRGELEFEFYQVPRDGVSRMPQRIRLNATLLNGPRRLVVHLPEEDLGRGDNDRPMAAMVERIVA